MMILVTIIKDRFFSRERQINRDLPLRAREHAPVVSWSSTCSLSFSDLGVHYFQRPANRWRRRGSFFHASVPRRFFLGLETACSASLPPLLLVHQSVQERRRLRFASVLVMIGIFHMRYNVVLGGE